MSTIHESHKTSQFTQFVPSASSSPKVNGQSKSSKQPVSQGAASSHGRTAMPVPDLKPAKVSSLRESASTYSSTASTPAATLSTASGRSIPTAGNVSTITDGPPIVFSPYLNAVAAIQTLYISSGGPGGFLGNPTNDSAADALPDGVGFFRAFQFGSIYWSPQTGAHEVHGAIFGEWARLGWERSFLGYPLTDETGTPDGVGRFNHFQGGSVYWTPQTGAHEVHGGIRGAWATLGWERSFLGYPLTEETGTPDGVGRFNHFQGGSIYWTPQTGAHEVHGAIRDKWASMGWETGYLGYPVSNEYDCPPGRCSDFQNGRISWTSDGGAVDVPQLYVIDAPNIVFGTGLSIGGNARLTLASNGVLHYQGHLHDSGFPSYDYLSVFTVKDTNGQPYGATHTGRTHGTDEPGSRDSDWDETTTNDLVRQNWQAIVNGSWGWKVDITSDWSPQKIAEDIAALVGTAVGIIALFV